MFGVLVETSIRMFLLSDMFSFQVVFLNSSMEKDWLYLGLFLSDTEMSE